jgi:hypothetical protein
MLVCGDNAPYTSGDRREYRHKRIAVYGTRGYVHWQMTRWEYFTEAEGYVSGQVDYGPDDIMAQVALTATALRNLDESAPAAHATPLEIALAVNGAILGCYASTLNRNVVELPFTGDENLLPKLAGSALIGFLFG